MPSPKPEQLDEKRRLAQSVLDAHARLQMAMLEKRRWPREAFREFFVAATAYTKATAPDEFIDRRVAACLSGLRETLELGSKRVPGDALHDADRLESMLFAGYDPYFEGDEPPDIEY
jgi:hypothetical protein